ncbi:MAG: hypothetical protein ACK5ME_11675 [Parahaliea sp.]
MFNNSKSAKLILYLVCAAIIGRTAVYLAARYSAIYESVFGSQSIAALVCVLYLILVLAWSVLILTGWRNSAFWYRAFRHVLVIILLLSISLVIVFYFIPVQEFQPMELVYVVHDMSILAVIICVLCWLVGTPNIGGILALNRQCENH